MTRADTLLYLGLDPQLSDWPTNVFGFTLKTLDIGMKSKLGGNLSLSLGILVFLALLV